VTGKPRNLVLFGAAAMILATVAAYAPSIGGSFLWDDDIFTYDSPVIRDGLSPMEYWSGKSTPDYYPVLSTTFWVQWQFFERDATGYRVVSLLEHIAACLLLWRVLLVLRLGSFAAWLGAMLFALHPVNATSVAWIAEQKNTLSLVFGLGAMLAHLDYDESGSRRSFAAALVLFGLGLLCKASIVVLPAGLVVLIVWRRGALRRQDMAALLPMFAVAAAGAAVTIWFQSQHATAAHGPPVRPEGLASRIAASGWIVWFYVYKALVPLNLTMIYPRWSVAGGNPIAYLPLLALAVPVVALARKRSAWLVPLAWFLLALLPVLGFIDMVYHRLSLVADHLMYVALPGATTAVAVLVARGIRVGWARGVAVAALCLALFALTFQRSAVLHDSLSLWSDSVQRNPDAPAAHNNFGDALAAAEPQRAVEHFRRAIELNPDYAKAYYNLAFSLAEAGRLDEAIETFGRSLSLDQTDVSAQRDLGRALLLRGRAAEGLRHLRVAASLDANHTHVKYWLGIALSRAGQHREAIGLLRDQVSLLPEDAVLRYELGSSLLETGEAEAAAVELRRAHALAVRDGNAALVEAIRNRGGG
jgi:tetratricopeptide (TPR) repeat protein